MSSIVARSDRLVVRLPDLVELDELAERAREGVFEPGDPLTFAWHDPDPTVRARSVIQHSLRCVGNVEAQEWRLPFCVLDRATGAVLGSQSLGAQSFPVLREVATGSWLTPSARGRGVGREMRATVLVLAQELGAHWAVSGAFPGNAASLAVSRSLGYQSDGIEHISENGVAKQLLRRRLDLRTWTSPIAVEVCVPEAARELLGAIHTPEPE